MTLKTFSEALTGYDMRAFQVACENLKNSPRHDGETSFPDFGTILAEMDACREMFPRFSEGAKEVNTLPVFAEQKMKRLK